MNKKCICCGVDFKVWLSIHKRGGGLFCSRKCRGLDQTAKGLEIRECLLCSREFEVSGSRKTKGFGKYCSFLCYGISKRSPSYKDDEKAKIRKSWDYTKWRKSVYHRDDYTCQLCGERGGKLHADHIKPFAYYPELRLDLSNGRTLCIPCHRKTPTYGGYRTKV